MDRVFGQHRFESTKVENCKDGFVGMELHRHSQGEDIVAARVLYWDACGQFYVETCNCDVPLAVLEELISEAKQLLSS